VIRSIAERQKTAMPIPSKAIAAAAVAALNPTSSLPSLPPPPAPSANVPRIRFRSGAATPLRSSASFLARAAAPLSAARSLPELRAGATALRGSLLATGAFRSVEAELADGGGGAQELVVTLEEARYSASARQQFSQHSGVFTQAFEGELFNVLGEAERLSVSLGQSVSGVPVEYALAGGGGGAAGAAGAAPPAAAPFALSARFPSVLGGAASAALSLRRASEPLTLAPYHAASAEVEASLTDAGNRHSVALLGAWRQLVPAVAPGGGCASSPAVAADARPSLKTSLVYAFSAGAVAPSPAAPASGQSAALRVEVAGIGGDARFAKGALSASVARSAGRFAPDTGHAWPSSGGGAEPAGAGAAGGGDAAAALAPFSPRAVLGWWRGALGGGGGGGEGAPPSSPTEAALAAWLCPGFSLSLDATAGALLPLAEGGRATNVADKFFLGHASRFLRGVEEPGPRSAAAGGALEPVGGDLLASATARLLAPPPLPIPGLVALGARSYAWASIGALAAAGRGARGPAAIANALKSSAVATTGVGMVRQPPPPRWVPPPAHLL